jgi:hypothetical protein
MDSLGILVVNCLRGIIHHAFMSVAKITETKESATRRCNYEFPAPLLMKRLLRSCVGCGSPLKCEEILSAGPFPCPACHTQLRAPKSYARWIALCSLLIPGVVFWALGFGGLHLISAVLLVWFPVGYLALHLVKYVMPPKIEIYLPEDTSVR